MPLNIYRWHVVDVLLLDFMHCPANTHKCSQHLITATGPFCRHSLRVVCSYYPTWNSAMGLCCCLNGSWKFCSSFCPAFNHLWVDLREVSCFFLPVFLPFSAFLCTENQGSFPIGSVVMISGCSYCVNKWVISKLRNTVRGIMPGSHANHRPDEVWSDMVVYTVRKLLP